MDNQDEKIAELSVLVDGIKKEIPNIQENITKMNNAIAILNVNANNMEKDIEKLIAWQTSIAELQYIIKNLSDSDKNNRTNIENIKEMYHDLIHNPPYINNNPSQKNDSNQEWTLKDFIITAPNIIAIISSNS